MADGDEGWCESRSNSVQVEMFNKIKTLQNEQHQGSRQKLMLMFCHTVLVPSLIKNAARGFIVNDNHTL